MPALHSLREWRSIESSAHIDALRPSRDCAGTVNCHRVQQLFKDLGEAEDEIFRQRKEEEERQKARRKRRKMEIKVC